MAIAARPGDIGFYRDSGPYLLAFFLLAIPAFWPTYWAPAFERDWHVHLHGASLFAWAAMLVAQPWLIHRGRVRLHRQLGKLSYLLAPMVVISTLLLAHYRLQSARSFDQVYFLWVQLGLITLFAVAYAQAIRHRRSAGIHARYMVCTALAMLDPIVARLLFNLFGVDIPASQLCTYAIIDAILVALWIRDARTGNGILVFPRMLAAYLVIELPTFALPQTAAWEACVEFYSLLPLP